MVDQKNSGRMVSKILKWRVIFMWKRATIVALTFSSSILVYGEASSLKDDYLSIVRRYNEGTIYVDNKSESNESSVEYFLTNSPFKAGLSFSIDEADSPTMQDMYLRLVKRVIRGILDEENTSDYDRPNNPKIMKDYAYTHVSGEAFNTLRACMEDVEKNGIVGDFVETGVWRGGITMFMKAFLHAYENHERKVWVADSFEGWPPATDDPDSWECNNQNLPWIVVPIETVRNNFQRYGLLDDKVIFLKGWFKDTLPTAPIEKIAVLRIDGDLYDSTKDALEALYPKLEVGGYVIIDDYYYFPGCDRAVNEYRKKYNVEDPFFRQGPTCSGVCWKKSK